MTTVNYGAKETFVRQRLLAEFGNANILDYLGGSPGLDDQIQLWVSLADRLLEDEKKSGNLGPKIEQYLIAIDPTFEVWRFASFMSSVEGVTVYLLHESYLVKYPSDRGWDYVLLGGNDLSLKPKDFVRYVASNWFQADELGGTTFLKKRLKEEVELERRKAEQDFDRACAVSRDNKNIINADYVVIVSTTGDWEEFDASRFWDEKLPKPLFIERLDSSFDHAVAKGVGRLKAGNKDAVLVTIKKLIRDEEYEETRTLIIRSSKVPKYILQNL